MAGFFLLCMHIYIYTYDIQSIYVDITAFTVDICMTAGIWSFFAARLFPLLRHGLWPCTSIEIYGGFHGFIVLFNRIKGVTTPNGWFLLWKIPSINGWLGVALFQKTTIYTLDILPHWVHIRYANVKITIESCAGCAIRHLCPNLRDLKWEKLPETVVMVFFFRIFQRETKPKGNSMGN